MTPLRRAWAELPAALAILEPLAFAPEAWSVLERLHARFNDREAHVRLPLPIARFRAAAVREIHACAQALDEVETVAVEGDPPTRRSASGGPDAMARHALRLHADIDAMMRVLVPSARYRKGHYAYGRFTVAAPHGLHTDHTAEDPAAEGEPICIARIETLGTHYVAGDERALDEDTRRLLASLRYWTPAPEGEPEAVLDLLLRRGVMRTIPVNHVVLMVAGNGSAQAQVTQHIAARPPEGGLHSTFFQRQYRLG